MTLRGRRLKMNLCLFVLIIKSMIHPSFSRSLDSLNFPDTVFSEESLKLSPPEPCQSGINFCGEDETKYPPQDLIESVINSNSKVQQWIDETTFHLNEIPVEEEASEMDDPSIIPACQSRREKLPNFLRFRNVKNKWKYIIKISYASNSSSNAEIMICEKPGNACINDGDSPDGEGSTVCRQAYRHQRLLAMDENGEASVDSFALPSGCICHHLQNDPNLRQAYILKNASKASEGKEIPEHGLPSVDLRMTSIKDQLRRRQCQLEEEVQIPLSEGRIRRSNDRIIFPGDTDSENIVPMRNIPDEDVNWGARSGDPNEEPTQEEEDSMVPEVEPCPNGEDFCELLASYPKNFIDTAVNRSNLMNNLHPSEFNKFHSVVCQNEIFSVVDQRIGTFENGEIPLCVSITEIIHPQKGRNIFGQWRHIVNTDIYKQGVSLEKCVKNFEGRSCLYDGVEGIFPEATVCKQQYSRHPFVVISPNGEKMVELFKIPTACVCHILDKTLF